MRPLQGSFHPLFKAVVKALEHLLPGDAALLHLVQLPLHLGGKFQVLDIAEIPLHPLRDAPAQIRDMEVLPLLPDIAPVQDSGYRGSVGGGASDALLLHGADKGGVRIMRRGLGKVLIPPEGLQRQDLPLPHGGQGRLPLVLLLVPALLINRGVAGELEAGGAGPEAVPPVDDLCRHAVIDGVGHLAGKETAPDEPVKAVLLPGEAALDLLRRPADVAGADGLVGILGPGLGLVVVGLGGIVFLAIAAEDEVPGSGDSLLTDAQRVGTHVGDKAYTALALDVHALIELLGDGHGSPGSHAQLAGGLLLQRGGGERRRGGALLVRPLHALDGEDSVFRLPDHGVHLRLGAELRLLPVLPVVAGGKSRLPGIPSQELRVQGPVLLRLEGLDLPVPVVHHPGGNGLHPSSGKAPLDLLPHHGGDLVAHEPVQNPPGLLGVHQVLVDVPGGPDALQHHVLRDLVEGHPPGLLVRQVQKLLQVPGNGLPLPVRVRCEVDPVGFPGGLLQALDDLFLPLNGLIDRLKVVLHIHAEAAFGQIPEVAHAGLHPEVLAQIFLNGFGFRGRLHDDQTLFCHIILLPRRLPRAAFYSESVTVRV